MKIRLKMTGRHSADVLADGAHVGIASDCDGRWIIQPLTADVEDADASDYEGTVFGCYPARTAEDLAFALRECVDGVEFVIITPY